MTVHNINFLLSQDPCRFPEVEDEGWIGNHVLLVVVNVEIVHSESMMICLANIPMLMVIVFMSDNY